MATVRFDVRARDQPGERVRAAMDDDEKPPPFRVVSDNPNARAEKAARDAKTAAERALARAAASILRVMAGGNSASNDVLGDMIKAVLADQKLEEITGRRLSFFDVQEVMELQHAEFEGVTSDSRYREWQREHGMDLIVQGALRLAAHQLLEERPHFGGKYSKRLIEEGIEAFTTAFGPPPPPTKKQLAADQAARLTYEDLLKIRAKAPGGDRKPPARKKRWSPLDSRSYLDPKPEEPK